MAGDDGSRQLAVEMERHRNSSAALLDSLAQKLGVTAARGSRGANQAFQYAADAAHYMQDNYVKSLATGAARFIRRQPAYSIVAAAVAGYFIGRALRPR